MSVTPFTRREFIKTAAGGAAVLAMPVRASLAANPVERPLHGLSSFGELKYPPDYSHFAFATPGAPAGGTFAFGPSNWGFNQNTQTFNTLNSFVLRGEAPPRMELCFDNLMSWAWDEPDAIYGSLAETVEISGDRNRYRFALRPEARFTDGTPVTAGDVAFSMMLIKAQGHPQLALDMTNLERAEAVDNRVVDLVFNGNQSDRAILEVALNTPILSEAYYAGRPFDEATLEPPLSSGPWRVGRFETGRFIEYERNRDYWGNAMPFQRGLDHFDRLRIDFFRDRNAAFEAFKKGLVKWREEFTSKTWATEYDFPAMRDGRAERVTFDSEKRPAFQGWAVNMRRQKLADLRTREALGMLFDFEWTNRNIFYGAYERTHSFFEGSVFAARGKPSPEETALLEPMRDVLPAAAFGEAAAPNVTDGSGRNRAALAKASRLLGEAGWRRQGGKLVDAAGAPLSVEFLIRSPVFERMLGPYTANMRAVGIDASIRLVDASQYQTRIEAYDFDITGFAFSFQPNPTAESLRRFFHSDSASRDGTYNYPGIADPAVDRLVEAAGRVEDREALTTVLRSLDRVLRAGHYWLLNWHSPNHRVATWNLYDWPEFKPDYAYPVERLWWYDADKAQRSGAIRTE